MRSAWLGVVVAMGACGGDPPTTTGPSPEGQCLIDCPDGSRCAGNTVETSRLVGMWAPASECASPRFLDRCYTPVQTCTRGCRPPQIDDQGWCVEDQAARAGDLCATDAECADAAWVLHEGFVRRPVLRCDPSTRACIEDPSHETCDGRDDDEDGVVDEQCELSVTASYFPTGAIGVTCENDRIIVGDPRGDELQLRELGVPTPWVMLPRIEAFELVEGALLAVERTSDGSAELVRVEPAAIRALPIDAPSQVSSLHAGNGAVLHLVGNDEVVTIDGTTGVATIRSPLDPPMSPRLRAARIGESLVMCEGDRSHWVSADGSIDTRAVPCGDAISDRGGLVLRDRGRALGRLGEDGTYTQLAVLPMTDDPDARVIALGEVAIRVSMERDGPIPILLFARVGADGSVSFTRRRLVHDVPVRLVDDASGTSSAAVLLEGFEIPHEPDAGLLDASSSTHPVAWVVQAR
ncbi:MAG: hypothetical protein K1X94_14585 [Sandaracinaceae bacterium]|nr:hypothetical protein [Sandaracinaceae bacterium]